ncbi:hypothetical protein SISNIDRAFT_451979 [Sistotremastrum niveocremeum HHB9708]|uniref:Uncharacterized protein n=1 Tax=Sistotremastrum niveocremeum HHB9708 TaxID=1314777 RepID=A0A164WUZ8_9AGAM|nr:hypothetical protein SISNIDRAFT_451979 [Sistotremastrum niveocremeum HHB9708]
MSLRQRQRRLQQQFNDEDESYFPSPSGSAPSGSVAHEHERDPVDSPFISNPEATSASAKERSGQKSPSSTLLGDPGSGSQSRRNGGEDSRPAQRRYSRTGSSISRRPSSLGSARSRSNSVPPTSSRKQNAEPSSSTLPLFLTFAIPVASFFTGSDILKDILLLLGLVFYLHQLIKVPWELYMMARPRHRSHIHFFSPPSPSSSNPSLPSEPKGPSSLESHLHLLELIYLTLSILSPLLGSLLLRSLSLSLSPGNSSPLSWFSTSLFALAAGLRPWNHLIERLRGHTEGLQDAISIEHQDALQQLREQELAESPDEIDEEEEAFWDSLRERVDEMDRANEDLKVQISDLQSALKKSERTRLRDEKRFAALEELVSEIHTQQSRSRFHHVHFASQTQNGNPPSSQRSSSEPTARIRSSSSKHPPPKILTNLLQKVFSYVPFKFLIPKFLIPSIFHPAPSSSHLNQPRRLETVPEESDDHFSSPEQEHENEPDHHSGAESDVTVRGTKRDRPDASDGANGGIFQIVFLNPMWVIGRFLRWVVRLGL